MKFEITQYHIAVPLTETQWDRLSKIDDSSRPSWPKLLDSFTTQIKKKGGESVEFNGHFGRNIFFTVEKTAHIPRILKYLCKRLG